MTDLEKETLHDKIVQEIQRIKVDRQRLEELISPDALADLDEVSRMDAIVSRSVHEASLSAAGQRLGRLEYALKRIPADPEFGYCAECGEKIPLARLMSMPEVLYCVECAEKSSGGRNGR